MSSMQEDIQCAGSDTRPPMLDRTGIVESWQQRIRLYCLGKDNGENIMKSIKEGPFQMGTVSDVITGGTEGEVQQGPVRARVLKDLSAEEKERYKADIRATNILLQELTKVDRESQLYVDICTLPSNPKEKPFKDTMFRFSKVITTGDNIKMPHVQTISEKQCKRKWVVAGKSRSSDRGGLINPGQAKPSSATTYYFKTQDAIMKGPRRSGAVLDEYSRLFLTGIRSLDDLMRVPRHKTMFLVKNLTSYIMDEYHDEHEMQNDYVEDNEEHVVQCNASSVRNDALMSIFDKMHEQGVQTQILLSSTVDHYKSKTEEVTLLKKDFKQKEDKFLEEFLDIKKLKDKVEDRLYKQVELDKGSYKHYKELYDSIKINRAHTSEKTSTMLNEIESLKAQLRSKEHCLTSDYVTKVLAPGMYAIDVKPIPHPLKNNRSAHLNYIGHLKESVETVREIVEEARAVKPLDSSLNYACRYTKLSQELLECVIGTCPKNFNERDNKAPSTPVTRKKQVTFSDKPGTSSSNTQKHKVHQRVQLTNIPVLPSTGVNDSTEASGSKPRSNTKKNRILPAKKENKKEVEVRLRTNRSVWTKVNRVDSSISSKRVVINSNSESVNSASNGMCVVNVLNSVNATPTVRIVLHKEKQIWKPKGKLSDNSLNKTKQIWKPKGKLSDNSLNKTKQIWKPKSKLSDNSLSKTQRVWKATGKLFAEIGHQWRPTGKKLTLGKLDCGSQWRPTGKKFALGEMCHLTKLSVVQVMLWYLDSGCSKHMTGNRSKLMNFVEKFIGSVRFGNDHLGAIMGYGDYVMGDSVISRVYYVEGLGHNLFSVGQFCDSDLEVAFRKHTCFVRDLNGTDILKGSRGTNLYTISIDEMMKSSPICLLSKASKSKSWLWHRRLNHLNFGTINDLARKDLVRGLPRLKFEKDHLCSACQLGKSKKFSHRPKSENTNMEVLHTLHMDLTFLWAEAVATACYTQNRSLIHTRHNKTPYELVHEKKPDLTFFRVFGALCYPTNDSENLGKFQAKADIGIFVGYAPSRKGYRIYNKRTRRLMETIHVTFDEMHQSMAPVR
ncbi:integrase, catalytic region, zinc finger, CCHC-type containing protein, partial [Tanacetum coccineum]